MFRSIRGRLVLSYVLLALITVSLVGALGLFLIRWEVARQEREHLTANAEAVAHQALPLLWPVVQHNALQELVRTSSFFGDVRVRIFDGQQQVLADSRPHAEGDEFVWILLPQEMRFDARQGSLWPFIMARPTDEELVIPFSYNWSSHVSDRFPSDTVFTVVRRWDDVWGSRFVFGVMQPTETLSNRPDTETEVPRSERVTTVPIGEESNPLGYVELSEARNLGSQALETSRRAFLVAAVGAMVMAVVLGLIVGRGLTAPLRELTNVAGQMSGGDLSTRAPVQGRDEIAELAGQFNQMAERLETSFAELASERDTLRRFIADASHELRTPITALKSFNELLQGAAAEDPAARTEFLAESRAQLERLEWITRNLLDLSRLDAGLVSLQMARYDAGALIESAVAPFKAVAQESGISLSTRKPQEALQLECDRAQVELALANLVQNALKFTPKGGHVEVGAEAKGEVVRIWVRDTGSGVDPEDQPYIFRRFYQGRAHRSEGSGLGLAIAGSVVEAHGGRISVVSEAGEGSLFTIELPMG